jgi:hypothetical protein
LNEVKAVLQAQDNDLDLNMVDRQSSTFLHAIAKASCRRSAGTAVEEIAELLLAEGVALNTRDSTNSTPLHLAAANGNLDLIQIFLKWNADTSLKNRQGRTALLVAQTNGQSAIADLLVHHQQVEVAHRVPLSTQKVTLVEKSSNTLTISWTVTGKTNEPCLFELQVGRARGVMALQGWQQTYKDVDGCLYMIEGLQPACSYVVRVRAYNKFKAGAWARSSAMTTLGGKDKEGSSGGGAAGMASGVLGGIATQLAKAAQRVGHAQHDEEPTEGQTSTNGTLLTGEQTYRDVDALLALVLKQARENEEGGGASAMRARTQVAEAVGGVAADQDAGTANKEHTEAVPTTTVIATGTEQASVVAMPSRQALVDFYKTHHDPSKTPKDVDAIIKKFGDNPEGLVEGLRVKYGEVPAAGGAGSAVAVAFTAAAVPLGDRVAKLTQHVSLLQQTLAVTKTVLANAQSELEEQKQANPNPQMLAQRSFSDDESDNGDEDGREDGGTSTAEPSNASPSPRGGTESNPDKIVAGSNAACPEVRGGGGGAEVAAGKGTESDAGCSDCDRTKELFELAKARMRSAETKAKEEAAKANRAEERARNAEERLKHERVLLKTYLESFAAFHTERHSRLEKLLEVGKCPRR